MKTLINNVVFSVLALGVVTAHAQQSSSELTCRAKAKEVAAQTYSGCVTDARNAQIDQIRKDYLKQLGDLKAKYDRELKKLGGKPTGATTQAAPGVKVPPVANAVSTGPAPKATKGIARTLPTRKEVKPASPQTQETPEAKAVSPDSQSGLSESSSPQNDANGDVKIELAPAPAASDNNTAGTDQQTY